jgi:dethiobiotin synthetase
MSRLVVAGTDTDVGKTVLCAGLVGLLDASYWKPVQSGTADGCDSERVRLLAGIRSDRVVPEAFRLRTPASPHYAAESDGVEINAERLMPPETQRPLVIELAGGLMVPLNRRALQIDVLSRWEYPVVLAARTRLGTINHTLLSIEALRRRSIPLRGVVFIGEEQSDSERTICEMGATRRLGRLPWLDPLDRVTLTAAMAANFKREDFL